MIILPTTKKPVTANINLRAGIYLAQDAEAETHHGNKH